MDPQTQTKLQTLMTAYRKNLPNKIDNVEMQWQTLSQHWDAGQFKEFYREIHSLCGSTGLYGYSELSNHMRELEVYLKTLLECTTITGEQQRKIDTLLNIISHSKTIN